MADRGIELRVVDEEAADRIWEMDVTDALEVIEEGALIDPDRRLPDWLDDAAFAEVRRPFEGSLLRRLDELLREGGERPIATLLRAGKTPGLLSRLDRWFSSLFEGSRELPEIEFDQDLLGYFTLGSLREIAPDALELIRALAYGEEHGHGFEAFVQEGRTPEYAETVARAAEDLEEATEEAHLTLVATPERIQRSLEGMEELFEYARNQELTPHPIIPQTYRPKERDPLIEERRKIRAAGLREDDGD